MADGVRIAQWDTASEVLAIIANVNRRRGKPPLRSSQFHPFRQQPRQTTNDFFAALSLIVEKPTKDKQP